MKRRTIFTILILLLLSCNTTTQSNRLIDSARSLLENDAISAYHGWIKYLIFDVQEVANRPGITEEQKEGKINRLELLVQQLNKEHPTILQSMRGVQEWAYESSVDGSGQPFMITIPKDYEGVSKWAVNKLTDDLAVKLKDTGVRINTLDPGWLRTDLGGENADHPVEAVLPGALAPALIEDEGPNGQFFSAIDHNMDM